MSWVQIPSPTPSFQSLTSVKKARVGRFGKTWVKNCDFWRTLKTQVVAQLLAHSTLFLRHRVRVLHGGVNVRGSQMSFALPSRWHSGHILADSQERIPVGLFWTNRLARKSSTDESSLEGLS